MSARDVSLAGQRRDLVLQAAQPVCMSMLNG